MQGRKNINYNFPKKLPQISLEFESTAVNCRMWGWKRKEKKKLLNKSIDFRCSLLHVVVHCTSLSLDSLSPTWEKTSIKDYFFERRKNNVFVNFCISCIINCVSVGVLAQWEILWIKGNALQGHWNKMKEVRKIMKCSLRRGVCNSFILHV